MERFCKDLTEHVMEIINFEVKIILLNEKENKFYEKEKVCYICQKKFKTDENDKNEFKL